jgi:hypothetical protein
MKDLYIKNSFSTHLHGVVASTQQGYLDNSSQLPSPIRLSTILVTKLCIGTVIVRTKSNKPNTLDKLCFESIGIAHCLPVNAIDSFCWSINH